MSRRLLVAVGIVLLFVGVGAGVALLTRDDSMESTARSPSTSPSDTSTPTTTAPSTTTTAPTTTAALATTTTTTAPVPADVPDPCGPEGAAIKTAIDNAVDGATNAQVDRCRLAAIDPSWAAVQLVAKAGADFDAVTVLVHGGGGSWAIIGSGSSNVGCGAAPQQVLVDLGIVCSSAGGGGGL